MWSPHYSSHTYSYNISNNWRCIQRVNYSNIYEFYLKYIYDNFLYIRRDPLLGTSIFVYAITSPVNGYFGGALYSKMGGRKWIKQMLLSAFLLPLMAYSMAFLINLIAIFYHVSRVIPFSSMVTIGF